jgi:subtilisin family serine protease
VSILAQILAVGGWLVVGPQPLVGRAAAQTPALRPSVLQPAPLSRPNTASGTYDAGEYLQIEARRIRLLRSQQKVAVLQVPAAGVPTVSDLRQIETADRLYRLERRIDRPDITVYQTRRFRSADEQAQSMSGLEKATAGAVVPVYVHEDSGLEMIPTGKIVVKLKKQDDLAGLAALNSKLGTTLDRPIRGTADQYVLAVPEVTAGALFALCTALRNEPAVEWAEPDFISQAVKHAVRPNDPLFDPNQWHLKEINAPEAWDIVTGSDQIIIAFLDDGMDCRHEDLIGALPSNAGEIADNGQDDDGNGWKDDVNGWNFHDDNNNPNPASLWDDHGTQVAGVAAATGNNGKGGVGCAFGCKLMPLKVIRDDALDSTLDILNRACAEALYYAAGQTADGHGRWRGADVISISLGFPETNLVYAALKFAVQHGRNDRGCPTLCAAGNSGSGWMQYRIYGIPAGTHHYRWEMVRDGGGSDGKDTVWLDSIVWPGGTVELVKDWGLPTDWKTGGEAKWVAVQNDNQGNHAMTGWAGKNSHAVRPGPLSHYGRSFLDIAKTCAEDGAIDFYLWPSMQESYPSVIGDALGATTDYWPFCSLYLPQDRKTQFICNHYELGWNPWYPPPIRKLKFAEFELLYAPSQRIDQLTIRLKHIAAGRDRYDQAQWDESGWTTVFEGANVPLNTGTSFHLHNGVTTNLIRFDFTREFTYDPNYNLAVDISMREAGFGVAGPLCVMAFTAETRTIIGEEVLTLGPDSPLYWSGSRGSATLSNFIPQMWFGSGDEVRFFVDGMLMAKASGVAWPEPGVSFPASSPYTIAVGASTDFGLRSDYSQFGPDLDFVAPSSGGRKGITTTDLMGSRGSSSDNYSLDFGGTSSATPLASGVAALMLSRNPKLTAYEVRVILRQTCQEIGDEPYKDGRNDHYGSGMIDAKAAVTAAGSEK